VVNKQPALAWPSRDDFQAIDSVRIDYTARNAVECGRRSKGVIHSNACFSNAAVRPSNGSIGNSKPSHVTRAVGTALRRWLARE
jgi:hypothetical protein